MCKALKVDGNEVVALECNKSGTKCHEVKRYSGKIDIEEVMSWKRNNEIQKKKMQEKY